MLYYKMIGMFFFGIILFLTGLNIIVQMVEIYSSLTADISGYSLGHATGVMAFNIIVLVLSYFGFSSLKKSMDSSKTVETNI